MNLYSEIKPEPSTSNHTHIQTVIYQKKIMINTNHENRAYHNILCSDLDINIYGLTWNQRESRKRSRIETRSGHHSGGWTDLRRLLQICAESAKKWQWNDGFASGSDREWSWWRWRCCAGVVMVLKGEGRWVEEEDESGNNGGEGERWSREKERQKFSISCC